MDASTRMQSKCNAIGCNKKLGLILNICRCEKVYCAKHRLPETHNCSYDYKLAGRTKLEEDNKCIAFQKILKI